MIEPKLPEYGPIQVSLRVSDEPYQEGKYAPCLHIRAYHENVKEVVLTSYMDDKLEMEVPKKFYRADMETFISVCGKEILEMCKKKLDDEWDKPPEPLTYESKIPYFGEYVPIRILPENESVDRRFENGALFLESGLSSDEIRDAVLDLYGDMAYGVFKKKVDYYTKIMDVKFNRLEIDDGRRGFGSFNEETKVIFLSRRLMMFSELIIDSVIVHELAHTKVFEHSEKFHDELLKIMPDYDEVDGAFYENADKLLEQGWI